MRLTPLQESVFAGLMWDYNYTSQQVADALMGHTSSCGHYDAKTLFCKLLENYPWFTVIQVLPLDRIVYFFEQGVVDRLRLQDMKKEYSYVAKRLQNHIQTAR